MPIKLCFPESALAQHIATLGKTGSGKSSALRHIVENRLDHKKRVCIVDPKGDWWGLKSSADGKSGGYPVIAFGDFKEAKATDVPINAHSGKHVAELVATGNRPCIIGFRGWMPAAMTQFWIDFAATLFNLNAGELYLFVDEVHNFAPKGRVMDPAAGKSLHWMNRLMSEGRGIGLICAIASQRPQKVHNDTLTCCETLVAMKVVHKSDRMAIQEWIDGCGDGTGNEILKNAAALERGEAYVWSPEIGFGPQKVKFPMFSTFDSFAPPQLQRKISDSGWADVDLGAVREKLATVIEEAKANDPGELKKEIARLKNDLRRNVPAAPIENIREVMVVGDKERADLDGIRRECESIAATLSAVQASVQSLSNRSSSMQDRLRGFRRHGDLAIVAAPAPTPRITDRSNRQLTADETVMTSTEVSLPQQKILDVVAMLNVRRIAPNRDCVARWLGIHPNGGSYGANLGHLRSTGLLDGFNLTASGQAQAGAMETGLDAAKDVLEAPQAKILDVLSDGQRFTRDSLAEVLGIHPNGGSYGANLGRLRTMGLIPERGEIYLTDAANL